LTCSALGCKYIFYDNPIPVVAAVVERPHADGSGSDVVLARGVGWPASWFGLVTGFLERGETTRDGMVREVKEELGIDVKIVQRLGVFDFLRLNQLFVAYHVIATDPTQPIKLDTTELADFKLIPVSKLKAFPGPTGDAVKEFLRRRQLQLHENEIVAQSRL
jgi:NADH pyrophosphatase NudC (nudix superfamily)